MKIAPDLEPQQIEHLVDQIRRRAIDGVIATNTTVDRAAVAHLPAARESGGLSGAPVRERALRVIAALRAALPTGFPIIGVGGIVTADDALACRAAGADLVQLYTGLVYRGPALVPEVARALAAAGGAAGGTRPASR